MRFLGGTILSEEIVELNSFRKNNSTEMLVEACRTVQSINPLTPQIDNRTVFIVVLDQICRNAGFNETVKSKLILYFLETIVLPTHDILFRPRRSRQVRFFGTSILSEKNCEHMALWNSFSDCEPQENQTNYFCHYLTSLQHLCSARNKFICIIIGFTILQTINNIADINIENKRIQN